MPVAGPTAALVLARALERRVREAWLIGLGSALPEGLYAFLACWGIRAALARFPAVLGASRLVGGIVLAAIGVWLMVRASTVGGSAKKGSRGEGPSQGRRGVVLGLLMTVANPTLLLTWSAAVGALHSVGLLSVDSRAAAPFALGVVAGVSAWFAVMIRLVAGLRDHLRKGVFAVVVRGVATLFIAVGVVVVARAVAMGL
jgi:threonine/homoserine/homoserine lactone efflux protein